MRKISVYDEFNPQDIAMMQALYSRSPQSVTEHVKKVRESGSGKFMEKFYVGYGHMSIADCGSTTIFIEKISILADKAVQHWPLYSGQETSTRYIDMSKQPLVDPVGSIESKAILDRWMRFYIESQKEVGNFIKSKYPKKADENEEVYKKAVNARTFDSLRAFLPAGITTQLSWHTNLRQAWDKLALLRHYPLPEVREIAEEILEKLREKYSHSFSHPGDEKQEEYFDYVSEKYSFFETILEKDFSCSTNIDSKELEKYQDIIEKRSLKTGLPQFMADLGNVTFEFILDYGSFRDIHRHRNGVCRMPLLTTKLGFNQWYLDQLPESVKKSAEELIKNQIDEISKLDASPEIQQYYIALGFNVACSVTYGLPATLYVTELRSGRMVHPTLRKIAHKMHHALLEKFPKLKLQTDLEPDMWDVRRGLQDIKIKE
jgi:thymidylate synthase ThyX